MDVFAKSAYHLEGNIEPALGAGTLHDKVHADSLERGVGDRQAFKLAVRQVFVMRQKFRWQEGQAWTCLWTLATSAGK
jgi:hypothetical protein